MENRTNMSTNVSHLNSSSMVDLKAELFRKQEEYKKNKLCVKDDQYIKGKAEDNRKKKKSDIFSKQNKGVFERAQQDAEVKAEEEDVHERSRKALEAKARLYDKITNSSDIPDEDGSGTFLVDFQRKVINSICEKKEKEQEIALDDIPPPSTPDEEWVDYVDFLGRSRRCLKKDIPAFISQDKNLSETRSVKRKSEDDKETLPTLLSSDMYREIQRKKWQEPVGPIHYANVQHNEIRTHGVGFYQFSKTEGERKEQMENLTKLRDETITARSKMERIKEKRKAQLSERLSKVKERRKMKEGYIDKTDDKKEEEIGPKIDEMITQQRAEVKQTIKTEEVPKDTPVREWDRGKEKKCAWSGERYYQERREEREAEFAPPSIYSDISRTTSKSRHQSKNFSQKSATQTCYKSQDKFIDNASTNICEMNMTSNELHTPATEETADVKYDPTQNINIPLESLNQNLHPPPPSMNFDPRPNFSIPPPGFNPHMPPPPPISVNNQLPPSVFVHTFPPNSNINPPSYNASFVETSNTHVPVSFYPNFPPASNNYYPSIPQYNHGQNNVTNQLQTSTSNYNYTTFFNKDSSKTFDPIVQDRTQSKPVPKFNIVDTRLVNKEDGIDELEDINTRDNLIVDAVPYKPGSFYLASLKKKNDGTTEVETVGGENAEYSEYKYEHKQPTFSGGAVIYKPEDNQN